MPPRPLLRKAQAFVTLGFPYSLSGWALGTDLGLYKSGVPGALPNPYGAFTDYVSTLPHLAFRVV